MAPKTPSISPFDLTALGPESLNHALDATQAQLDDSAGQAISNSAAPISAGDLSFLRPFGPFTQVEPLSEQGAMGLVARGYNAAFDRWELLKFLRGEHAQNPEFLRQFQREGRVLAKLSHPNVVQVFAIYALNGRPCLAMEFLEGESLQAHANRSEGKLPVARWYDLLLAAARGLAAAHEVGLLHRDIKPDNLFVVEERKGIVGGLKLIDFGLATADLSRQDVTIDPSLVAAQRGGTPLFMAPELWRQQEASPRTDLFALGMTFFVVAAGQLPYMPGTTLAEVAMTVCSEQPFRDIRDFRPDLPAALAVVLQRLLAKSPEDRFENAMELIAALVAASAEARTRRVPGSGPYRGLSSFSSSERDVFFGRETEVVEILERLRTQGGIVLVGPSGSGKSSLAYAGVLPAVEDGALGGGLVFRISRFEPRTRPLASLAAALCRAFSYPEEEIHAFLRTSPESLGQHLRSRLPPGTGLLLVIDQLEELATLAEDPNDLRTFSRAIGSIIEVPVPELHILATLRADLMDRLFSHEALRPLLTRGFYPVRPLLGDGLRQALVGPAKAAGYTFESTTIVDSILDDVTRSSAGLPLMSFAMSLWWQARDEARKVLPTAAWQALGGIAGALARHGDGVLESMGAEERRSAEQILLRLVTADGTKARVSRTALLDPAATGPSATRALERMLQAKLLHESSDEIELVHESLLTQWPTLRTLLHSSGEDRAFRERVAAAAHEWDAQGRPAGALWTGEQALRLLRWFEVTPSALDQTDLAFLDATRARRARRKLFVRAGTFFALAVIVIFLLIAKRTEQELQERLTEVSGRATQFEANYRKAEGERLRALAERYLEEDPSLALSTAFESYEKSPAPSLDILAWRARFRGLPYPLPLHSHGAQLAKFSPRGEWITTSGGDGTVFLLSSSNSETARIHPSRDDHALPNALLFHSDTLTVGSSIGELTLAQAPQFSPTVVDRCHGPIPRLGWLGDTILRICSETVPRLLQYTPSTKQQKELAKGALIDLALSKDETKGIAAYRDGKILYLSPQGQTEISSPARSASHIAISSSGDRWLISEKNGTIYQALNGDKKSPKFTVFSTINGRSLLTLKAGPQNTTLAIDTNSQATLWIGEKAFSFEVDSPVFAWSSQRSLLLLTIPGNSVSLISLLTGEVVGRLQGSTQTITAIDVDPTGTWAIVASKDGATRAYHLEDCHTILTRGEITSPAACTVASDGSAIACAEGQTLRVVPVLSSVGGLKAAYEQSLEATPAVIALSPRGEQVSWAAPNLWKIHNRSLRGIATPLVLRLSERSAALAGKQADGASVLQLAPLQEGPLRTVSLSEAPISLAFSRSENQLLVLTSHQVLFVDPDKATLQRSLPLPSNEGTPTHLAISDDETMLVLGFESGAILTLDPTKQTTQRIRKFPSKITCMAWAQTGRAIVVTTADQLRFILDTDTGNFFLTGRGHSVTVGCARSPIEDRFTYIQANGSALLRLIDTAPLTMSRAPDAILDPRTMPLQQWPGFPKIWR